MTCRWRKSANCRQSGSRHGKATSPAAMNAPGYHHFKQQDAVQPCGDSSASTQQGPFDQPRSRPCEHRHRPACVNVTPTRSERRTRMALREVLAIIFLRACAIRTTRAKDWPAAHDDSRNERSRKFNRHTATGNVPGRLVDPFGTTGTAKPSHPDLPRIPSAELGAHVKPQACRR